ncbi:MAG: 50S ribosomal protein L11 methyltransferase, partial [Trueperaceae bacterium]
GRGAHTTPRTTRPRPRFAHGSVDPDDPAHACNVLVANLFAELHVRLMPAYARVLRPGGTAVLTGILHERAAQVTRAVAAHGLQVVHDQRDGAWRLLALAVPVAHDVEGTDGGGGSASAEAAARDVRT